MALIKPLFSYEQLLRMPDDGKRYEILEGELLVSPSPVPKHQRAVGKLFAFLLRAEEAGHGEVYVAPLDVVFDPHNVAEPDVLFIRRERLAIVTETNVRGAPDIVVEVLSPGTRARDFGAKLRIYARFEVTYYWVVDPEARTVRPYALRQGSYVEGALLREGEQLSCPLFPDLTVDVATLFA